MEASEQAGTEPPALPDPAFPASQSTATGISRRAFFGGAVASAAAGAAVGITATGLASTAADARPAGVSASESAYDFYGQHQAGIRTPPQDHLVLMVFDVTTTSAAELQVMLAKWSAAIAQYTGGLAVGAVEPERDLAVPGDTGEA